MSSFLAFSGSLYSMPATHAEDDHRRTILVVDDDENLRTVLEYSLHRAGYAVLSAGNARDAQRLVATSQVALILLDLYLPGFDDLSLLLELKSRPASQQVPVVVLPHIAMTSIVGNACQGAPPRSSANPSVRKV